MLLRGKPVNEQSIRNSHSESPMNDTPLAPVSRIAMLMPSLDDCKLMSFHRDGERELRRVSKLSKTRHRDTTHRHDWFSQHRRG